VSPRRLLTLGFAALATAAALSAPLARARAQQVDVIRGRITGPDSLAIEGAAIRATSMDGNVTRNARTDRSGRFTITFPGGDGDYMIAIAAIGYVAKRFEVKRVADEEILIADARLQKLGANVLDAVKVTAQRDRPNRNEGERPDIGGSERPVETRALPPAGLGDLAAMAASLPGFQYIPGADGADPGFSAFGLGADQNNITLNGMQFGGANLPRDAAIASSVATSPYDVSRGGFSGAQMSLRTRPGSNYITRGASLNLDSPHMQWTDRASSALAQQYSNISLGGLVSGPIVFDKAYYNVAYQLGRRASDLSTMLSTSPLGLQAAGISADSVARLMGLVRAARIPATLPGLPTDRLGEQGSIFGSVDLAPPSATGGQALNITFNGSWNAQRPASGFATELPSFGGERTNARGGVQARHSGYFDLRGVGILTESSLGVSGSRSWGDPYLDLPAGRVLVSSSFGDGTGGVQMLSFGGNPGLDTRQSTIGVDAMNQLSWFSANNKHRLKLTSELREETASLYSGANLRGSFAFNSLADLEAGRPASFTRSLSPRERSASQLAGALSLGDAWRPSRDLQLQYGVRVDANDFLSAPAYNADVERLFGARNDRAPSRVYVSPRVGFSWTLGTAPQVAAFEGAARGPRAVVRGGVGLFQNTPSTALLGAALDNTGLASAMQQITCVGAAAPVPDWSAYASDPSSIPTRCADGSVGTVFANGAPNVTLFSRDWNAPRSARGNLQWSGPVLGNRFMATVDGTYSLNLNQPGFVDLNFAGAPRFTLADEGNRPVYASASSIVPATGATSARDALVSPLFSHVSEQRSDLRSVSRQLSLRLAPLRFSTGFNWSLSYVYSNVRERFRGFTSTAGNPLDLAWGRSSFDSRHQIVYSLDYDFFDAVRVSWFGQLRSGSPYTPMIAGDVNGDGYVNDRAFIFDPRATGDTALASAMRTLLAHGSRSARDCLAAQLGALAGRNSCEGPWSSTANLSITFNPAKVRMPQRASLSLSLSNPLGAADLIMHGSNGLRGWGQPAFPDAQLLYVRGFDPATRRYAYDVNQRFGATNPAFRAFSAPVTLTALVRIDLGPTRERQQLTQRLDVGRTRPGEKVPEPFLKALFSRLGLFNPIEQILRQQDSLQLTPKQADSVASLNRAYAIRVDSIWSPVAKYLDALPAHYDQGEAYGRYLAARRATVDLLSRLGPAIHSMLTAEQRRKLPPLVASYLDPRYLATIRSGTVAFTGGMALPGMGGFYGTGGNVTVMGGGGGAQVIRVVH
jgi:hypothetical protein